MATLRFALLATLILAALVQAAVAIAQAPVEYYTDTGGGGTIAQPHKQTRSGGTVAPLGGVPAPIGSGPVPIEVGGVDDSAAFRRNDTPTAEPAAKASAGPAREKEPVLARPQAVASQTAPTVTGGDSQANSDAGLIGALPLTGLQLALVLGAGLVLLLGGYALRPRRRAAA
jgi:hypothetical protein